MSYTEINDEKGLRYGGMPYDVILRKLEETDPELVADVRGRDEFHDVAGEYKDYVRGEIIDWAPDAPYLEADHARRDPALSRSTLNLRYNGTRGSNPELPRHPELFYGFMGDDPRGVVNDPRMDQYRGQMAARAANLEVRMGQNDDNHVAERPWTNQSISYSMKELHRRVRGTTKVFTVSKEGRPIGRNVVMDELVDGALRRVVRAGGAEGLAAQREGSAGPTRERFYAGDQGAPTADGGGVRRVDRSTSGDTAPWRRTSTGANLHVQKYGQTRGGARKNNAVGAELQRMSAHDQDFAQQTTAVAHNKNTLAATMAAAVRAAAAPWGSTQDTESGFSMRGRRAAKSAPTPRDVARAFRAQEEDTTRRPSTMVSDGAGGAMASAGLVPARNPEKATRAAENTHVSRASALADLGMMVRGTRETSASERRKVADMIEEDGRRVPFLTENSAAVPKSATAVFGAVADPGAMQWQSYVGVPAMPSTGLEVRNYTSVAPQRASAAEPVSVDGDFGAHAVAAGRGKAGAHEFVSNTQMQSSTDMDMGFSTNEEVPGRQTVAHADMNVRNLAAETTDRSDFGDSM